MQLDPKQVRDLQEQLDQQKEPMGFVLQDDTYTLVTWNDATKVLQIAPVGASFDVWVKGKRFTKSTPETKDISGTIAEGLWYFYYDSAGVLQGTITPWVFGLHAPVALLRWDATGAKAILSADERHGLVMPWATHHYLHDTIRTRYASGLGLAGTIVGDGSLDAHAQVDISGGTVFDEDIEIEISDGVTGRFVQELSPIANIPIFYLDGATPVWRRTNSTAFPLLQGISRIAYNLDTAGTWTQPDTPSNGNFVAVYIFASSNRDVPSDGVAWEEPVIAILGQRVDGTLSNAQDNNELGGLTLPEELTAEAKPIYRLIFQTSTTYANAPHARLRDMLDYREISTVPGTNATTVHNSLAGRSTYPAHPGAALSIPALGGAAYDSLNDWFDTAQSSGVISGGAVTPNVSGTSVDVAAGEGIVKVTDSSTGASIFFPWSAATAVAIAVDAIHYVYADYNGGSPIIAATTTPGVMDGHTKFLLSVVFRKGTTVWTNDVNQIVADMGMMLQRRINSADGIVRVYGMIAAETGVRYLTITVGSAWGGLSYMPTPAFDTSGADTFDEWYRSVIPGIWTQIVGTSQVDNVKYDDGSGTLANLGNNQYGVRWLFLVPNTNDTLHIVYGRESHTSLAAAQTEAFPSDLVPLLSDMGLLIARVIVREGQAALEEVSVAFGEKFDLTSVSDHNSLTNLQGGVPGEYYHLTSAQHGRIPGAGAVATTTNAWTTIATIAVADPETVLIDAHVSARRTNGPDEERAGYIVRALGYRAGAGAVREGNENTPFSRESHAAYDAQIIASGNDMLIQVKGDTGHDVSWVCKYTATRV